MRKLADQENVDAPSSNYPKGSTRDRVGVTPGTTGNVGIFGDIIQFFQKLVGLASITENELPDNETNDYQLIEAIGYYIRSLSASTTEKGVVEKATSTEASNGIVDKFIDAELLNGIALGSDPTFSVVTGTIINNNIKNYYNLKKIQFSGTVSYSDSTIAANTTIMTIPSTAFNPAPSEDIYGYLFIDVGAGYEAVKIKYTTSRTIVLLETSPQIGTDEPFNINLIY